MALRGIRFAYERDAWSLSVPALDLGTEPLRCIVGPNGSGKSTLLRVAAGLLQPTEGSVTLEGRSLKTMPRRSIARRLGYLPQEGNALYDYSVQEVACMGRYPHSRGWGALTARDREAVEEALAAVGLTALRDRPLSRLSGGERRRALIASVLAQETGLLLLDEPTAALDVHHAVSVMRLLSSFDGGGPSVVVVTHDINLAAMFAHRLTLLVEGAVRADGPPSEVIRADVMEAAYGGDVAVHRHPETGDPMVVPRRLRAGSVQSRRRLHDD